MNLFKNYLVVGTATVALLMGGCTAADTALAAQSSTAAVMQSANQAESNIAQDDAEDAAEGTDVPITGSALDQASAAALEFVGEGRVTDTEIGDEEGYYEIEVTLDNGSQVDVHLDESFNVLSQIADDEQTED